MVKGKGVKWRTAFVVVLVVISILFSLAGIGLILDLYLNDKYYYETPWLKNGFQDQIALQISDDIAAVKDYIMAFIFLHWITIAACIFYKRKLNNQK